MLPSELLVAKVRGGTISPVYLALDGGSRDLAEELISIYSKGVGRKRGEILEATRALEGKRADFRVVRGLCALIERRGTFETKSPADPTAIREAVFGAGAPVLDGGRRRRIIEEAAKKLGINPDDVQRHMWSDTRGEMVLASLVPPSPEGLIAAYNLSLTQTLVFKATSMEIRLGGNARQVLGAVKRLGLMYTVEGIGEGVTLSVMGAASAVKLTERYGTAVAKLLPAVFSAPNWGIQAQIMVNSFGRRRLLGFELSSSDAPLLPEQPDGDAEGYDSSVEESFARRFRALGTVWELVREPGIVQTSSGLIIPDFAFVRGGRRIYMEIVGFWTPQYLEKKVKKLRSVRETDFIVAVDAKLAAAEKLRGRNLSVIEFDREVPLRPILSVLEAAEAKLLEEEAARAERLEIPLEGKVVEISRLAASIGISTKTLAARLRAAPPPGYRMMGGYLLSEELAGEVLEALSKGGSLKEIEERLGGLGISDVLPVVEGLGYSVRWRGLSPDSAELTMRGRGTKD